ncbi:MAG: hypothetical protein PSX81_05525 [bacterium]|nr:hypothetical protein [bacterium]
MDKKIWNTRTSKKDLQILIQELERKQGIELELLKKEAIETYKNLNPFNLIKENVKELLTAPDLKDNIIGNVAGLATGYLSKAIVVGSSHNPITKIAGSLIQMLISNSIAKHPEKVLGIATKVSHWFDKKDSLLDPKDEQSE